MSELQKNLVSENRACDSDSSWMKTFKIEKALNQFSKQGNNREIETRRRFSYAYLARRTKLQQNRLNVHFDHVWLVIASFYDQMFISLTIREKKYFHVNTTRGRVLSHTKVQNIVPLKPERVCRYEDKRMSLYKHVFKRLLAVFKIQKLPKIRCTCNTVFRTRINRWSELFVKIIVFKHSS